MAFQTGTTASSDARRDLLTRFVAVATSQHVSAVAVNAAGTGYTAGDVLEITHAGAHQPCRVEVLTVSGGAISTVKVLDGGAFSNRVASYTLVGGGTGQAVGDILRVEGGTFTEFAKLRVDAETAGTATTVSVFETGGAYSAAPAGTLNTNTDIGNGSGSGLTVTATMTGLVGTTGAAATGGTGSSATFDLTLDDTGWSAVSPSHNQNNWSQNTVTDEKEVILRGTVAGGDEPYIQVRTYTHTSGIDTYHGWILGMADDNNPSLDFHLQQNFAPNHEADVNEGCYLLVLDSAQDYWMRMDGRHAQVVVKCQGPSTVSYNHCYLGLLEPYGTTTETPYPAYISGTSGNAQLAADSGTDALTGPTELKAFSTSTRPARIRFPDSNWWDVCNVQITTAQHVNIVTPLGSPAPGNSTNELSNDLSDQWSEFEIALDANIVSREGFGSANAAIMPTLGDNEILLWPCSVISTSLGNQDTSPNSVNNAYTLPRGDVSGIYWCPATDSAGAAMLAEDVIDVGGQDYILFQNAHRSERYSYFALKRN